MAAQDIHSIAREGRADLLQELLDGNKRAIKSKDEVFCFGPKIHFDCTARMPALLCTPPSLLAISQSRVCCSSTVPTSMRKMMSRLMYA